MAEVLEASQDAVRQDEGLPALVQRAASRVEPLVDKSGDSAVERAFVRLVQEVQRGYRNAVLAAGVRAQAPPQQRASLGAVPPLSCEPRRPERWAASASGESVKTRSGQCMNKCRSRSALYR